MFLFTFCSFVGTELLVVILQYVQDQHCVCGINTYRRQLKHEQRFCLPNPVLDFSWLTRGPSLSAGRSADCWWRYAALEGPLQQEGIFCVWCKSIQGVLILLTRSLTGGVWEAGSISNSLSLSLVPSAEWYVRLRTSGRRKFRSVTLLYQQRFRWLFTLPKLRFYKLGGLRSFESNVEKIVLLKQASLSSLTVHLVIIK